MAGDQERRLEFRIGEAFPADDPLARWMTVVAMSHNDLVFCNLRMSGPRELPPAENIYYFRLVASHYWELALFLRKTYQEWQVVRDFVSGLDEAVRSDFDCVIAPADDSRAPERAIFSLARELGGHRSVFFHYPELDEQKALKGREQLQRAMRAAAELDSSISAREHFGSVRFDFADEIGVQFFGTDEEGARLMERLREPMSAAMRFGQAAMQAYLEGLADGIVTLTGAEPNE
jgi:hypothetical protein